MKESVLSLISSDDSSYALDARPLSNVALFASFLRISLLLHPGSFLAPVTQRAMAVDVSEFLPIITVSEWNATLKKEILSWFSTTIKVITSQAW